MTPIITIMAMASEERVREYLAYWFQLGKKVLLQNGEALLPQPAIEGNRYSQAFERCWQKILYSNPSQSYLEGTTQTIEQLLSPAWDITACARCGILVPTIVLGIQPPDCPCCDLDNWPNSDLPAPRLPVNSATYLSQIKERLHQMGEDAEASPSRE